MFEKDDPCIKFLEMVHIVDLIQQCVQAHYEEDVVSDKGRISLFMICVVWWIPRV
jgi:hypothetical protein